MAPALSESKHFLANMSRPDPTLYSEPIGKKEIMQSGSRAVYRVLSGDESTSSPSKCINDPFYPPAPEYPLEKIEIALPGCGAGE